MSAEFSLPLSLNLAPPTWFNAALIATYALPPLALSLTANAVGAWFVGAVALIAALALARQLRHQRPAHTAIRIESAAAGWRVHQHRGAALPVALVAGTDFRWFLVLLVAPAAPARAYRLLIPANQDPDQLHRLRVLLANPPTPD